MLFSFNDEFIAAMCGGMEDDDTLDLFAEGLVAMNDAIEEGLQRTTGRHKDVVLEGDMFVVDLDQEELVREYGGPGVMLNPEIRQGFFQSRNKALTAFDKAVNSA